MKIMGLDFGTKTCGVSMSDTLLMTAQPVEIIRRERPGKLRKTLSRIEELVVEGDVRLIVIGLPLNMDDSSGERVRATKAFAEDVARRTGVDVEFMDERLTTVEAYEIMDKMGIAVSDRYLYVDMIAANVILQDYMESHAGELAQLRTQGGEEIG